MEKELSKTEKQSNSSQTIKIAGLDVFISHDILSFSSLLNSESLSEIPDSSYFNSHSSEYFSRIFHPPLA
ncbi:protein of unknown function [Chryseobacterium sp. JV274]|nr:protein of unknown function [Chryseobacterium sp. JV274]